MIFIPCCVFDALTKTKWPLLMSFLCKLERVYCITKKIQCIDLWCSCEIALYLPQKSIFMYVFLLAEVHLLQTYQSLYPFCQCLSTWLIWPLTKPPTFWRKENRISCNALASAPGCLTYHTFQGTKKTCQLAESVMPSEKHELIKTCHGAMSDDASEEDCRCQSKPVKAKKRSP